MRQEVKSLIYVTTTERVVKWHLTNILKLEDPSFKLTVVADGASRLAESFPSVKFIDLKIARRPSLVSDIAALFRLIGIFKSLRPDIVHSLMPKAGLISAIASIIAGVPIRLHSFTGQVWLVFNGRLIGLYKLIDKIVLRMNTACLCDSPSQAETLKIAGIYSKAKGPFVIGAGSLTGVDVNRFRRFQSTDISLKIRLHLGLTKDTFVFSFIARKVAAKGAIDVLKSFNDFLSSNSGANAVLLFVGPTEDESVASLKVSQPVLFHNVVNLEEVDNVGELLSVTDVLCLPSYHEGFGSIVLDAASLKVPTIGYSCVGLVDAIVDGSTGILVTSGDIGNFTKAMTSLFLDESKRILLGENAYSRALRLFDHRIVTKQLFEFYNKLTNHR